MRMSETGRVKASGKSSWCCWSLSKRMIFFIINQECNLLNLKGSVNLMENQKNRASILFPFSLIEQRVGRLRTVEQMRLYSRL